MALSNQNGHAGNAHAVEMSQAADEGPVDVAPQGPKPRTPTFLRPQVQSLRPSRRRAPRACLACRARKIRCDVTQNYPCGNCQWSCNDCVIYSRRAEMREKSERARQQQKERARASPSQTPRSQTESTESEPTRASHARKPSGQSNPPMQADLEASQSQFEVFMAESEESFLLLPGLADPQELSQLPSTHASQAGELRDTLDEAPSVQAAAELQSLWHQSLPTFIKPPTPSLGPDDLVFLRSKGALTVPDINVQDALIRAYLEHVHPLLPLINVEDFIESITEGNESQSQVSLVFFQAVMFAGSAYVDFDVLKSTGFTSRKEARKALYHRVRLLYDFDTESDGLAIIPALLLMTFWYDGVDNNKNTWYWMDVAVSQAFAHSLHVDPRQSKTTMSVTVLRLRRRIWWSCFIRDRLTSFGMKRPPRIRDEHFNVPMLEISDFRSEQVSGKNLTRIQKVCSYFTDENRRTTLARLCVAQASLCRCLRHTAVSSSTARPDGLTGMSSTTPSLPVDGRSFAACQRDLLDWYDTLCHGDKYQPILAGDIHADGSANLELNRAVLHMVYHAGVLGLHRSRIYNTGVSPCERELSRTFIQHSAKRISEITSNIEELGLDRFLPMTAMSTTISATSVHLMEIRGVFTADVFSAQENYQRCLRVIECMKEIYCATDLAKIATEFSFLGLNQDDSSNDLVNPCHWDQGAVWDDTVDVSPTGDQFAPLDWMEKGASMPDPLGLSPFERCLGDMYGGNVTGV